ncbi:MAG TPA: TIM barrel protein [Candidatus Nanoarchaeia archaeon]|nr:TIM barrel protein [Candidatus Nanoarchaeia archaeon]
MLRFGPGGIPNTTTPRTTIDGIKEIKKLGLTAMELEFVHSVFIKEEQTATIKKLAHHLDIQLSSHSPYYLNLNAAEPAKLTRSIQLLSHSAIITGLSGGTNTAFHTAFYLGQPPAQAYTKVKKALQEVVKNVKAAGVKLWLRPELTGKKTQLGNVQEIIKLSQDIDMVLPCIDYAHYHAREGGGNNDLAAFRKPLDDLERGLGKTILNNMHIQIAGVNYTEKGERNHTNLEESDLNWKDIIKTWKEYKLKGVVIAETPNLEQDALLLQKTYQQP